MSEKLSLEAQIEDLKNKLYAHQYAKELGLNSSVELIHTLFRFGRTDDVPNMAREFLSDYPEYREEFIGHFEKNGTLMPIPKDPSEDEKYPVKIDYDSLMDQLGLLYKKLDKK